MTQIMGASGKVCLLFHKVSRPPLLGNDKQGLTFEIISAKIADQTDERKHVIYTLQVRFISGNDDQCPSAIERRYTNFLNLYNDLKKEQPQLMTNVLFPKKVLYGNFDNELISTRSTGFESLLKHISLESRLRNSNAMLTFLTDVEMTQAKVLWEKKEYEFVFPLFEKTFKLLNKIFTDRSPPVILALCRILACAVSLNDLQNSQKYADLALYRFEGVSDSDLLELYVPLLQVCLIIWEQNGRNKENIEQKLAKLQRDGVKVNECGSLMEVIDRLSEKVLI